MSSETASSFRWCFREQCLKYPWWDRKGRWKCAIDLLISASQTLKGKLHKLALESSDSDKPDGEEDETADEVQSPLQRVEEALHDIIALCQRSSSGLNQQQREVCICVYVCTCALFQQPELGFSWTGCVELLYFSLSLTVSIFCHSQALWFPLLEAMMSPQKLLKGADAMHTSEGERHIQAFLLSFSLVLKLCYSKAPKNV